MESHPYQIIGTTEKEQSLFFMLDILLRSRIETGEETTDDEDVNVYLSNLLHSFMTQPTEKQPLISLRETDIAQLVDKKPLGMQSWIYQTNADNTLITNSIFEYPVSRNTHLTEEELIATGKRYYAWAANLHERFKRKKTGLTEVLEKLSDRFETYSSILSHTRVSYLNLIKKLSQGEIFHIQKTANENLVLTGNFEEDRNTFLDAYSEWLNSNTQENKRKTNNIGKKLSESYDKFKFKELE